MIDSLLLGFGFAFAAGIQPGPLQTFLFSQVARKGWRRTLPAAFSPLLSDGPIALVVLLVLQTMPAAVARGLRAAGGLLLLGFAGAAVRAYLRERRTRNEGASTEEPSDSAPRTVLQAALVNLLNPNPYLGWSLVLGPAFVSAWRIGPSNAVALLVAFYGTMVVTLGLTIVLFGTTRLLGPRARGALVLVSAAILAGLGVFQLYAAARPPGPPS